MRKKEIYSVPKAKEYLIQTSGALLIEGSKGDMEKQKRMIGINHD